MPVLAALGDGNKDSQNPYLQVGRAGGREGGRVGGREEGRKGGSFS